MKWWGWLVIIVFGSAIWGAVVGLLDSFWSARLDKEQAWFSGVLIIILACVMFPLLKRARNTDVDAPGGDA